jgi:hypothetical protein
LKPSFCSFHLQVINAISKSQNDGKAQRALRWLRKMDRLYRAGNPKVKPNEVTYTAVLNSCAHPSERSDKRTRRKALDTAIFTLEELRSTAMYGQPNQITYGTFLLACANLLQVEGGGEGDEDDAGGAAGEEDRRLAAALRRSTTERAFRQCCQDGQVGEMVLSRLRRAAPDLYEELLADVLSSSSNRAAAARGASSGGDSTNSPRPVRRLYRRSVISVDDLPESWRCNVPRGAADRRVRHRRRQTPSRRAARGSPCSGSEGETRYS